MNNLKLLQNDETISKFKKAITNLEIPVSSIYLFEKYRRIIVLTAHNEIPNTPFDILVRNFEEFEYYKTEINTLYYEISQDGIEI
jgi:hypothetical protein